jgi:hypothetical protein
MPRTEITGDQVRDGTLTGEDIEDGGIYRQDLNITSTGKAVVRKVITSSGLAMSYTGTDPGTGDVVIAISTSGGLTAVTHRLLDQLVHDIAETSYYEITRAGVLISAETWWTDSGKTKKIRSIDYTYTGNKVTQSIMKQYDTSGNICETLTENYTYIGSNIVSIHSTLS